VNRSLLLACLAFAVAVGALTTNAYAQATRTWVSGVGDDANPCSRTAPCKTWAGAISKTAAGGEIDALDPGGFGALTITKSITLDGGGGQVASTLVSGTNGIVIAAGSTDVVVIRNLRLDGLLGNGSEPNSPGIDGIKTLSAALVNIENCTIFGFGGIGINFVPGNAALMNVSNSVVENDHGGGIVVNGGSIGARASIDHTQAIGNSTSSGTGDGVEATGITRVSITNSNISGNADGVFATGANAIIAVLNSSVVNNWQDGIHASNGGSISAAQTSISINHGIGVVADTGGATGTFGNNIVFSNLGGNGSFTGSSGTPSIRRFGKPPGI